MKITQVELYEVEIPPTPPIARYYPKIYDITLCRVQTVDMDVVECYRVA